MSKFLVHRINHCPFGYAKESYTSYTYETIAKMGYDIDSIKIVESANIDQNNENSNEYNVTGNLFILFYDDWNNMNVHLYELYGKGYNLIFNDNITSLSKFFLRKLHDTLG